jgi:two-component system chemotaxis response regulator CheY
MALLLKHREAPIPSMIAMRPETPTSLEAAFRKMVAKNPAERFQRMSEVVAALEAVPLPATETVRAAVLPTTASPPPATIAGERPSTHIPVAVKVQSPAPTEQTVALGSLPVEMPTPPSVLLVEPSRTQAAIIRQYLKNQGIAPSATVSSGSEALDQARKARPAAVASAMHLKDMTGVQLAQRLADEFGPSSIGFVLISSAEESRDVSATGVRILHKPFDADQLTQALAAVTRRELKPVGDAKTGLSDSKTILTHPTAERSGVRVDRAKIKVLLVDDSTSARLHERAVLLGLGLTQITEAADGAQAVAALAREQFDLIVTDYNMPLMDGHALIGYLRQNPATASVPVIMVTTEKDEAKLDPIRKLGVAAICDKSFAIELLRPHLERLFG